MGAVVGQRGGTGVGQDHQIVDDDARLLQLGDSVELAARQSSVAEPHVLLFGFAPLPAGQAGVEKQFAVELIGDQIVELVFVGPADWGPDTSGSFGRSVPDEIRGWRTG